MAKQINALLFKSNLGQSFITFANSSDILQGKNRVYILNATMDNVTTFFKDSLGKILSPSIYGTTNWYAADNIIGEICATASSVPRSYTVFSDANGQDYLVGWGTNATNIYVWPIVNGTVTSASRSTYAVAPAAMANYSRAGWDGGKYIYFLNTNNRQLYRWDLTNRGVAPVFMCTVSNLYSISSSYTGSGMLIKGNYVYFASGADQGNGLMGFDMTTGLPVSDNATASTTMSVIASGTGATALSGDAGNVSFYSGTSGSTGVAGTAYYFWYNATAQYFWYLTYDIVGDTYINPIQTTEMFSQPISGKINVLPSSTITEFGLVWSTSANPIIATGSKVTMPIPTAVGNFSGIAYPLTRNTTYYIRAYITDANGNTNYSNQQQFTTLDGLARSVTLAPTNIGLTTMDVNGIITGIEG